MKKRISVPFLAAAIVVLALLAVIVIAKPFPQKASAVFPEKLLELPCTVARESIDGAEKAHEKDQKKYDRLLAKGKVPDWEVAAAAIIDLELVKKNIVHLI